MFPYSSPYSYGVFYHLPEDFAYHAYNKHGRATIKERKIFPCEKVQYSSGLRWGWGAQLLKARPFDFSHSLQT